MNENLPQAARLKKSERLIRLVKSRGNSIANTATVHTTTGGRWIQRTILVRMSFFAGNAPTPQRKNSPKRETKGNLNAKPTTIHP